MSFAAHYWNRPRRYHTAFKKRNIYDFFKYTSLVNAAQKPFFKLFNREFSKCPPAKHANIKHFFCWLGESTTIDIVKKVYGVMVRFRVGFMGFINRVMVRFRVGFRVKVKIQPNPPPPYPNKLSTECWQCFQLKSLSLFYIRFTVNYRDQICFTICII